MKTHQLSPGSSSHYRLMELLWKVVSLMHESLVEHHGILDLSA
jgi:hypothetical protein